MTTRFFSLSPMRLMLATLLVATAGATMPAAWAQPTHGGGGMMGHPRMMERMLDGVNATPEQRTQIQQITQAARPELDAQREAGQKLRQQMAELMAQPTVDARAVESLRQQMLAQHDQVSKRMTQLMLDVSRVLTPEQRKQIADRMAQRRSMMERHRQERESMEQQQRRL